MIYVICIFENILLVDSIKTHTLDISLLHHSITRYYIYIQYYCYLHCKLLVVIVSDSSKGAVEWAHRVGDNHDFLLENIESPIMLLLQDNTSHQVADFVFDWSILWMVLRSSKDGKISWPRPSHNHIVNIRSIVSRQVVPNKDAMIVSAIVAVLFDVGANGVDEIMVDDCRCTRSTNTPNPSSRMLETTTSSWG